MSNKTSDILLRVTTDENKIPESITWSAEDGGVEQAEAKAAFLFASSNFSSSLLYSLISLANSPLVP